LEALRPHAGLDGDATRLAEFDAVRGLAALSVVLFHLVEGPFYWGWMGVDVFFVLSGFLITRIILRGQGAASFLKNFYARRAIRIWPIYYLALLVAGVLALLSRTPQPLSGLPYALFFVQNVPAYWGGQTPPYTLRLIHIWSIAVEEQFYLIWPLLLPRLGRRVPWVIMSLLVIAFGVRLIIPRLDLLLTRCDGLALGAALAWYSQQRRRSLLTTPSAKAFRITILVAVVVYACWRRLTAGPPFYDLMSLWRAPTILAVNLAAALLILEILERAGTPLLAPLRGRALVYIGQISYGIYLYHLLVFWIADGLQVRFGWQRTNLFNVLVVLTCLAVASASWHFIEQPILRFRKRFPVSGPGLINLQRPLPTHATLVA
jgi:peptidoglycan/LPS O-acetylase OafA/YrhL